MVIPNYNNWPTARLLHELGSLEGEKKQLQPHINAEKAQLGATKKSANRGAAETSGSIIVTAMGMVSLVNPVAMAAFLGGAFLSFLSGKNAFDASTESDKRRQSVDILNHELKKIEERLNIVEALLEEPRHQKKLELMGYTGGP